MESKPTFRIATPIHRACWQSTGRERALGKPCREPVEVDNTRGGEVIHEKRNPGKITSSWSTRRGC